MYLTKDVKYLFVGGGDKDALDINVEILAESGKVLARDDREAPEAMVNFVPPASDWYTLRLSLAKSIRHVPCICVVCVLRENGVQVPQKSLNQASERLLSAFVETDKLMQKQGKRLELRHARNQWAFYGSVIEPGVGTRVTNLDLGVGRRGFLAVGDDNCKDADLFLMDSDDKIVAQDADKKADAFIAFDPVAGRRYAIRWLNYKGSGPSVVLTGFFDPYSIPAKK